ncbi:MAG: S8 family serine peptidase [Pirellulales bacterium]
MRPARRWSFECLEERRVLATAVVLGQELELPSWFTPEQVQAAQESAVLVRKNSGPIPMYFTSAEANQVIGATEIQTNPGFSAFNGSGRSIAIIDTGLDLDHPAYGSSRIRYSKDFFIDFTLADPDDPSDVRGHGTAIAGIAASVATGVDLVNLKVSNHNGTSLSMSYVEAALGWLIENNNWATYSVAAINLSISDGGNHSSWNYLPGQEPAGYGLLDEITHLANLGVTTVVGVGNNYKPLQTQTQGVGYPAVIPVVIGVGATYDADRGGPWGSYEHGAIDKVTYVDKLAAYSQRHSTAMDIVAPGGFLNVAVPDNTYFPDARGTSYAAPHVAAAVAIAQQMHRTFGGAGNLHPNAVDALLTETGTPAVDRQVPEPDDEDNVPNTGLIWPRLNVEAMAYKLYKPGIPDLKTDSDWGFSETDNKTANKRPTFVGTAPAGSYVHILVGPYELGSQQLDPGVTNYSIQALPNQAQMQLNGEHWITAKVAESNATFSTNPSQASGILPIFLNHGETESPDANSVEFKLRVTDNGFIRGTKPSGTSPLTVDWRTAPVTLTKTGTSELVFNTITDRSADVTFNNNEGTSRFDADPGISKNGAQPRVANWDVFVNKTTTNPSTVQFNVTSNIDVLNVGNDALAKVTHATGQPKSVLIVSTLILGAETGNAVGTLDLTNCGLVIDYPSTWTTQQQNDLEAKIRRWIVQGRGGVGIGNSPWTGKGITSSTAAAMNAVNGDSRSVGYGLNVAMPLGPLPVFMGQEVDQSSLLARYTVTGDMDLDGTVGDNDITIIGATSPTPGENRWYFGDVDYDGNVDDNDVTLVSALYGQSV